MKKEKITGSIHYRWVAIFCLVVVGFIFLGVLYYRYEAKRIMSDNYEDISAIAKLKADFIQDWRRQRLADIHRVPGPIVRREMARLLQDPTNPSARAALQIQLNINRKVTIYADALFLDTRGNILLSDNPNPAPVDRATMKAIEVALKDRTEVFSNFFRDSKGIIYIDAVAPIPDNSGRPIAIVVLRSKAADFLYPFIQSWPTPSKTSETFLVRRDGDFVLFLNELRYRSNTALTLRFPLTATHVPSVQAALGNYGRFLGRDYRGVEVLAVSQPVSQSPWSIVAKVDAGEILTEVKYRSWIITIIVTLIIGISAGLIWSVYRKRQEVERKQAEEALKSSEKRYRRLFETAQDGILILDAETEQISDVNPFLVEMLGYSHEDFLGKKLWEIGILKDIEASKAAFLELQSKGYVCYADLPLETKDGRPMAVEFVSIVYPFNHHKAIQCNIRDITKRKLLGEALKNLTTNWNGAWRSGRSSSGRLFLKSKQ